MGRAYVAKPGLPPAAPDVPPGWIPGLEITWPHVPVWPHPGPYPPGYEPVYSFALSAPPGVEADGVLGETVITLRDHDDYATVEPKDSIITWTAKMDSQVVLMRFGNTGEYATSLTSNYSVTGDYWGASPSIEFDITEEDGDKTIVLTAESQVGGQVISASASIFVGRVITAKAGNTYSVSNKTSSSWIANMDTNVSFRNHDDEEISLAHGGILGDKNGYIWDYRENEYCEAVRVDQQSTRLDIVYLPSPNEIKTVRVGFYLYAYACTNSATFTFDVYINGVLDSAHSTQRSRSSGSEGTTWLDFDVATGEVTVL